MGRRKKKLTAKVPKRGQIRKTLPVVENRPREKWLKPGIVLLGVFVLALFIRLVYLYQILPTPIFQGLAVDDEKYEILALQILNGNFTYKEFIYLNPLYPFFLAIIYLICGQSHLSVVITQAIIDSLSCILIYYIASQLFNKRVGIIACFTYACYAIAIFYTGILLAPTVVIFFTLLFIASLLMAEVKRKIILFFISGLIFGLAVLARPNIIIFLFFLPLWFFSVIKSRLGVNKSIQGFLLVLVGFSTVMSPIIIRNYSIEKRLSPFPVQGGINFYIGNNPKATGCFMSPYGVSISPIDQVKNSISQAEEESGKKLTPSQASRYWFFRGLQFIKDSPLSAFSLYIKKFALFWRKEEISLNIDYYFTKSFVPILRLPFISFGFIAPLAILGIILSLKRRRNVLLIILLIFSHMVSVITFFVSARYRLPVAPLLIIFSSYALSRLVEMARAKQVKEVTAFGALLVLLFVGINRNFEYFESSATSKTNPKITYNNIGNLYSRTGRLDEAIVEFKKALSIDPYFAEAHNNLGIVYRKKGLIKEAMDELNKALKIKPDYTLAHYTLGLAYEELNRLDESIFEYKKVLAIDPDYAEAYNKLGLIYEKKGMLDEAIEEYKKALSINPNLAKVYTNLGTVYDKKGMSDKAIEAHKKALSIMPDLAEAHNNLCATYYYRGIYKLAILHCDKAIELEVSVHPKLLELLKPYR